MPENPNYRPSTTVNQRGDWDFVVIEKAVLVPLSDDSAEFTDQNDGTRTYGGMSDVVPNHKAILREDSGQVFYIGSNQYQPVQHRVVLAPVIEALTNNADIRIVSVNHGGRVYADFLDIRTVFIGDEEYRGGIRIINSLDGTYRLVIESIIHRTKTNSRLLLSQFLTTFYRRHILGSMDTNDFARAAREAVESVHTKMRCLDRLTHINITEVAFRGLVQKLEMAERYKQLALDIWQTPEIVEMERSDTAMAVVAILAYIGTHELTRTLNEEALYKWQRNVDSVLSRTLMPYMEPHCSNHAAPPCPDYAPQTPTPQGDVADERVLSSLRERQERGESLVAPAPTPVSHQRDMPHPRLSPPTTQSFPPPADGTEPSITNVAVHNQALTREQLLNYTRIVNGQRGPENIDELLERLERDLQPGPDTQENPPIRPNPTGRFDVGDRVLARNTRSGGDTQEGRIVSQNSHHDRFLVRFTNDGSERWIQNNDLSRPEPGIGANATDELDDGEDNSYYDSLGKGGIASR